MKSNMFDMWMHRNCFLYRIRTSLLQMMENKTAVLFLNRVLPWTGLIRISPLRWCWNSLRVVASTWQRTQQLRHAPLDKELGWEHNNQGRPQSSCISTSTFLFSLSSFRSFISFSVVLLFGVCPSAGFLFFTPPLLLSVCAPSGSLFISWSLPLKKK